MTFLLILPFPFLGPTMAGGQGSRVTGGSTGATKTDGATRMEGARTDAGTGSNYTRNKTGSNK